MVYFPPRAGTPIFKKYIVYDIKGKIVIITTWKKLYEKYRIINKNEQRFDRL